MEDLYFLKLIAHAFRDLNPRESLTKAFEKIELLGRNPEYKQEHLKFRRFMAELRKNHELLCQQKMKSEPDLMQLEIHILKDGKRLDSFWIPEGPFIRVVKNARPGAYSIKLNTGRLLFEERLTERDLLWVYAFPEEDLLLAADTGDLTLRKTQEISLLEGDLVLRVYPGIEAGHLELEVKDAINGE